MPNKTAGATSLVKLNDQAVECRYKSRQKKNKAAAEEKTQSDVKHKRRVSFPRVDDKSLSGRSLRHSDGREGKTRVRWRRRTRRHHSKDLFFVFCKGLESWQGYLALCSKERE